MEFHAQFLLNQNKKNNLNYNIKHKIIIIRK